MCSEDTQSKEISCSTYISIIKAHTELLDTHLQNFNFTYRCYTSLSYNFDPLNLKTNPAYQKLVSNQIETILNATIEQLEEKLAEVQQCNRIDSLMKELSNKIGKMQPCNEHKNLMNEPSKKVAEECEEIINTLTYTIDVFRKQKRSIRGQYIADCNSGEIELNQELLNDAMHQYTDAHCNLAFRIYRVNFYDILEGNYYFKRQNKELFGR